MSGTDRSARGPLRLRFVTSAAELDQLPRSRAEVAVAGRSNVGKSSLINALAAAKDLAKTSSTPGRTQLLNCFAFEDHDATFVDLPGYGYAKASKVDRATWHARMERYLLGREPLVLTLLLVDGEVGPTKLDVDMLAWLRASDVPFHVVATKHDKVKSSKRERRKRDLAEGCGLPPDAIVWVSVPRKVGLDRVRDLVRDAVR